MVFQYTTGMEIDFSNIFLIIISKLINFIDASMI